MFTKEELNKLHKAVSDSFDSLNRYAELRRKYKAKMSEKLYTREELLRFIKMNKPMPNKESYFFRLSKEQHHYIADNFKGVSVVEPYNTISLGDGKEQIVVENGYILPYEPTPNTFDAELEKHEHINTALKGLKEVREKMKDSGVIDREQFLLAFNDILLCAQIKIDLDTAERIVKLHALAKEKGHKTTVEEIEKTK